MTSVMELVRNIKKLSKFDDALIKIQNPIASKDTVMVGGDIISWSFIPVINEIESMIVMNKPDKESIVDESRQH